MNVMKVISATGPDPALAQGGHIRWFFGAYYRNPNQLALRELEQSAGNLRLRRIARRRSSFAFRYAALRIGQALVP